MKKPYIIAGRNGAAKTTASYTILPEILDCDEFVNADEIARGLSPFQPKKACFQAGGLMLARIKSLIAKGKNFAFETTLATKGYKNLIEEARAEGYPVTLLFFYLDPKGINIKKVAIRVKEGRHDTPEKVIMRGYDNGLKNFSDIFKDLVDEWFFVENPNRPFNLIAETTNVQDVIHDPQFWNTIKSKYPGN